MAATYTLRVDEDLPLFVPKTNYILQELSNTWGPLIEVTTQLPEQLPLNAFRSVTGLLVLS